MITEERPVLSKANARYCQFLCDNAFAKPIPLGTLTGRVKIPAELVEEHRKGMISAEREQWFKERFEW